MRGVRRWPAPGLKVLAAWVGPGKLSAVRCDTAGWGAPGNRIGVLGMKPMGNGYILESKTVTAVECLHYAMSLPTATVITGIDSMEILKQALDAAKTFQPLSESRISALLARTAGAAAQGRFEKFKTENLFDGTAKNPGWLESADIGPVSP